MVVNQPQGAIQRFDALIIQSIEQTGIDFEGLREDFRVQRQASFSQRHMHIPIGVGSFCC
ncbi:MAG: hypothetical protein ABS39_03100 [Acidovorax sp. SCN 65-28]|nr:MAG: hypothetical protein ABS39_03100 [Acidovorax sp. SCN 65-28]OJT98733.1 MAG: hypothetical protein BGN90_04410 [Acidovorax sp. 65-7]